MGFKGPNALVNQGDREQLETEPASSHNQTGFYENNLF